MFSGETIKVFTLNNHSLYLCSENKQLGKSVIITTNLNKSKVTQYKEELLYIVPEMSLENLLKQYKLFNEFIDLYLPQRDIELIRRKDGIHIALLCSYFLKHLNLVEALLTLQTLDIGLPEQKYMESLKEYEQSIKRKFKIKIQEVLPNKTKIQQVESCISKDAEPEVKSELAQSIVMSQAVFEERLIEQRTFSTILLPEDQVQSEYIP